MKRLALFLHVISYQKTNNMKKFLSSILLIIVLFNAQAQKNDTLTKDTLKNVNLKQVEVKAVAPIITVKTDKILLNVESMLNADGLNALELLRQAPGVTIDGLENVKISGKNGIQVLLDGRLQNLSSQQLTSLLKGTNASNIKAIEIITNPSAKYDAAGNAGIINIIFKKSELSGSNGNLSIGYQQMKNYRQNSAFNYTLKQRKFNLFATGNFDNSLQSTEVQSRRILTDKFFEQNGIEQQGYSNPGIRVSTTYELSKKHKIGADFNFQRIWDDFPSTANTHITGTATNDILTTSTLANLTENNSSYNLNYQYNTEKIKFNIEADQLDYNSKLSNEVVNIFKNNLSRTDFENQTTTKIALSTLKTDLTLKLGETNFETGMKYSLSKTDNLLNASLQSILQLNTFEYNEKIYAAYGSLNRSIGNWSFQIGLRAEHTQMAGESINELMQRNNQPDTSYLNLFPTAFLRYKINEKHSIGFSYSRRLNRPSFQDQNPYLYRTDFYYASKGNPLLLPQFTQTLELNYVLNGQTQFKLNFNQTNALIEFISTQVKDQTLVLPVNAGNRSFINLNISTPFKIGKFWNIYGSVEPYYQFYKADLSKYNGLTKIDNGGFGFNGYISNTFSLTKTLKGSLSSWYNYASRSSIYSTKPIYSIDAAVKKQLLSNKLTINLAMRDILNSQRWQQNIQLGQINQSSLRKWESRGLYLSLNYSFGNGKLKGNEEREKTEEQQRIKQRN